MAHHNIRNLNNTPAMPAAYPTQAPFVAAAALGPMWPRIKAPYAPRRYGQGRSLAAMLAARNVPPAQAQAYLNWAAAWLAAGMPAAMVWPR